MAALGNENLKVIIVSKQCDVDEDLFDLWLTWYSDVFPVHKIILTPVVVAGDDKSIENTVRFYSDYVEEFSPIYVPVWNDEEIWRSQKGRVAPHMAEDTLWISADADQFFDLSVMGTAGNTCIFSRKELFSTYEINPSNITSADLFESDSNGRYQGGIFWRKRGLTGGSIGKENSGSISATGHAHLTPVKGTAYGTEYHVTARGAEQFLRKTRFFKNILGPGAPHLKHYVNLLDTKGEEWVINNFSKWCSESGLNKNIEFRDKFKKVHQQ